jgi:hypothetical protein
MGCNCGGQTPLAAPAPEPLFEVVYTDGRREIVTGEHAAKVAATQGGPGTTYSRK